MTSFVVAHDLKQVATGGGDDRENIVVHRVPLASVETWLGKKLDDGVRADARVPSGLYLWKRERQ